jgi:calcium-independent phospholipase A2-gamma
LKNIERHCKKPIHEVFDYISGTSTGAVLAALLGIYKMPLNEIERQYKIFVKEIFQRNRAAGISSLIGSYGYYDTAVWESMLK